MTAIKNPLTGAMTLVLPCRVCGQPVYFGFTAKGKRCPYDVVDGEASTTSHFTTCSEIDRWRPKTTKPADVGVQT
jgi:hypothetical protein